MSTDPSIEQLQAEIAASRDRLAATIDLLTSKATPKALMARQSEAARARFASATRTPQGDLRTERLAAVAAAVAIVLVVNCLLRRRG